MKKTSSSPTVLHRTFHGIVTSDAMNKTIVVAVERSVRHPLYGKSFTRTRSFKVHDPENRFHIGDAVEFEECRPLSKDKRWRVRYTTPQKFSTI